MLPPPATLGIEMTARFHPLMEHADYFDETRFEHAVENQMDGIADPRVMASGAAVAEVKAADSGEYLAAIPG
jgi:hypothetical protein